VRFRVRVRVRVDADRAEEVVVHPGVDLG